MPTARTPHGPVTGRERETCLLFAGIPYAASTAGPRRFAPPAPPESWTEPRDATRFGDAAPQLPGAGLTDAPPKRMGEDCLRLNVSAPRDALRPGRRYPVLVWIHGGGFRTGQGGIPWYDGAHFAARGIVTVSINYRLGVLGFANLAHLGAEGAGALGILDQIAALEWVRDNIEAFGGDPERVTIAGESAGGMSVGILLGSPRARGLFRGAIAQSGAAHHTFPAERSAEIGRLFCELAGVDDLEGARALPVEAVLDAQRRVEEKVAADTRLGMAFMPTVEGDVLETAPIDAIRAGASRDVRVLVGTNAHEATLFGMTARDEAQLGRIAARHFADPEAALAAYREDHPDANVHDLAVQIATDQMFRIPAVRLAEAHAAAGGAPYKYLFSWESRAFEGKLRATHALEIPFAFNTLDRAGVATFLGEGPSPQPLADVMHAAWCAFVHTGDPRCDAVPDWPQYEPETRCVMEFGERVGPVRDPGGRSRVAWDGLR
jgi:para-nitrobenzyl esterase